MLIELIGWGLLLLALGLLGLALNALRPIRRSWLLIVPSFLAGTLLAETAIFTLPVLLGAIGVAVWMGEPRTSLAQTSLGIAAITSAALAWQVVSALRTRTTLKRDIPEFDPQPLRGWLRLLIPFPHRLFGARVTRGVRFAKLAGTRLRLDVYHPPQHFEGPRPALVHIHGGGWVTGSKREQGVPIMALLSDRGYVGFNIDYRLSPGATWPEHLVDVKRAIAWVREHAQAYGVDANFVAVIGGSAGGHLTAMTALTQDDRSLQPGFEDADTSVQAAVPLYAVYDLTNAHRRHAPKFHRMLIEPLFLKAFYDQQPERFEQASPLHCIHEQAPPFFVVHGTHDSMAPLPDALDFITKLRETSKAPVRSTIVPGAHHSFDLLVSLRSLPVIDAIGDWLDAVRASSPPADEVTPSSAASAPLRASPSSARVPVRVQ